MADYRAEAVEKARSYAIFCADQMAGLLLNNSPPIDLIGNYNGASGAYYDNLLRHFTYDQAIECMVQLNEFGSGSQLSDEEHYSAFAAWLFTMAIEKAFGLFVHLAADYPIVIDAVSETTDRDVVTELLKQVIETANVTL